MRLEASKGISQKLNFDNGLQKSYYGSYYWSRSELSYFRVLFVRISIVVHSVHANRNKMPISARVIFTQPRRRDVMCTDNSLKYVVVKRRRFM